MSHSRQLAAIMFTDIVGYTSLMGKDESKAFELLNKSINLQKPLIQKYGGKWLKEMGDGVLVSFSTASAAVYCAGEIQNACKLEQDLDLRIGIHLGEVVFKDGDVFGAGVNVASRLESIAPVGGILISESVHSNVVNREGVNSLYVGEKQLKNIAEPLKVYELEVDKISNKSGNDLVSASGKSGRAISYRQIAIAMLTLIALVLGFIFFKPSSNGGTRDYTEEKPGHASIAILPFVNMSNDPDQEYFSDGISEEITNSLAQVPSLKVTARTSAFQFRGGNQDVKVIGEKLGVTTILEGSVRKSGNRVRVTAQLINVEDGFHIWSQTYDRDLTDIFKIQEELSNSITEALKLRIARSDQPTSRNGTTNLAAYNLYLKGRYFWNKRNEEGIQKSVEFFKQALDKDPLYAMAYVGMADAYNMMAVWNLIENKEGFQLARRAALNALELDDQLGPAYAALAYLQMGYDWNWELSRENFQRAQQLSPNYAPAFYWYSEFCSAVGDSEEAVLNMEKAIQLDPLSMIINSELAWLYMFDSGKPDLALQQIQKTLEMDGHFQPVHFYFYQIFYQLGNMDRSFMHFMQHNRWFQDSQLLENTYKQSGWPGVAETLLKAIESGHGPSIVSPVTIAEYYCYLEEYDKSLDFIEKAYQEKDYYLTHAAAWPLFKRLHAEPRFQVVIENMNLDLSKLGPYL